MIDFKQWDGFSGRICYQKNPMFLIEVFSEIKRLDPTAAFVICGEGDMREATYIKSLELGVEISFLGNVKNMQDYYQAMDCYILPSRYEGLGIVLIEAQCTGLQCVTSADVVPRDAQITELLEFVPIYETAQYWADICVRKVNNIVERSKYKCKVEKSLFNIKIEAPNLEKRIRKLESE